VALVTGEEVSAAFFVVDYEIRGFPVGTGHRVIEKDVWLSPEVLPVVRVNAQGFIVLGQVERAKHGFVVKNEEIIIELVIVDQLNFDVAFRVGERTINPVVALLNFVWVIRAELCLVFFWTVLTPTKDEHPVS
jgi:hypothetical protein